MEHVKTLRTPTSRTGASAGAGANTLSIQVDPCRFPIAPVPTSWDKVNKEHMESLYCTYMTQHYCKYQCLITVPACLSKQRDFIKSKYIPRGVNLDDPRTMKRESIVKLFEHIAAREISHGVQDAFRFKNILSSRKQGALLPSRYSDENDTMAPEHDNTIPAPAPAPRRQSKSQREAAGNVNEY